MDKYRKRNNPTATIVEAVQLTKESLREVVGLCKGNVVEETDALDPTKKYVGVNFLGWDGMTRASEGDYIIRDAMGDLHVRWPNVFETDFEKVE